MKNMALLNRLNEIGRHGDLLKAETELSKCLLLMASEASVGRHDRTARSRDLKVHRGRILDCAEQIEVLVQDLGQKWAGELDEPD